MKSINKLLTLVAILCISLSACQKDFLAEDNNPPGIVAHSNYLDKIFFIDSTGTVKDTSSYYSYEYDNAKRVIKLNYFMHSSGSYVLLENYRYFYNGNDTLPFKRVFYFFENAIDYANPALTDTTITFYFYNNSGKNLRDSILTVQHYTLGGAVDFEYWKEINQYQYGTNGIYNLNTKTTINSSYPFSTDPQLSLDTAYTDSRGNILSYKKYLVYNNTSIPDRTASFTYDNNLSPFAKLSNLRTLFMFPIGETFFEIMQSHNNRLKAYEEDVFSGTVLFDEDLTGKYTFNANRYPHRNVQQDGNPGIFLITLFTYKAL